MNRAIKAALAGLLIVVAAGLFVGGDDETSVTSLITGVDELIRYPEPPPFSDTAGLVVVVLPGTERAVLLRPITEEEFASAQVQAIAPEMIANQLLATAFVVPVVSPQDAAAIPVDLSDFLKRTINRISRFSVFDGVAAPGP